MKRLSIEDRWHKEHKRILSAYRVLEDRKKVGFFTYRDETHIFRLHERYWMTLRLLKHFGYHPLSKLRILDVGCGDGSMLRQFVQWGAKSELLAGIELRSEPLQVAHHLSPHIGVCKGSDVSLPWPHASFDLVCQHTVFSSVLDVEMRHQIAREMYRVLRPGGGVLWYDFFYNNPSNPHVRGVTATEIRTLFPDLEVHLYRITLAPFIARRIPSSLLPIFYPLLASIPFLRTHYLGLFIKK